MKPNNGHYFEILDRSHVVMSSIDYFLINHPALTKKQRKKLEKAQALIMDVY